MMSYMTIICPRRPLHLHPLHLQSLHLQSTEASP
uniref:Uncharacterized protein n=1 Tax=Arundo donax TaxID=35708 RepID=A0A0A9ATD3_ARUDO